MKKVAVALVILLLVSLIIVGFFSGWFGKVAEDWQQGLECSGMSSFEHQKVGGVSDCWFRTGTSWSTPPAICDVPQSQSGIGKEWMWMSWDREGQGTYMESHAIPTDKVSEGYKKINVYLVYPGGVGEQLTMTFVRDRNSDGSFPHSLMSDLGRALSKSMDGRQAVMEISDQDYLDLGCVLKTMVI